MKNLPDDYAAMTLTDIPYGVVNRESGGIRSFDKKNADDETFALDVFINEVVRVTSGSIYVFCATEQVSELRGLLVKHGLTTRLCIWEKTNPTPVNGQYMWLSGIECCVFGRKKGATFNEHCKNTVWRYPGVRSKTHPTEKSLDLFRYLIRASSNPNDIIFDPCAGSGTTPAAAILEGRRFTAFELDPQYVDSAQVRINDLLGKVA